MPDPNIWEPVKEDSDTGEDVWESIEDTSVVPKKISVPVEKSRKKTFYEHVTTTPEPVRKFVESVGQRITDPTIDQTMVGSMGRGFIAGGLEGASETFLNPLNAALTLLDFGEIAAARRGLQGLSKIATLGTKALSAPVAYEGGKNLLSPESTLQERLTAIPQIAGGALGLRSRIGQVARESARAKAETPTRIQPEATDILSTPIGKELDPRITSLVPERAPIEEVMGGKAGPPVKSPISESFRAKDVDVSSEIAKIEAAKEAARAEVDLEFAGPKEKPRYVIDSEGNLTAKGQEVLTPEQLTPEQELDNLIKKFESENKLPEVELLDELGGPNASIESAASLEALSI